MLWEPIRSLVLGLWRKSSHSLSVKSRSLVSGSYSPQPAITCQYQESTANPGTVIAPSFSDLSRSTSCSTSIFDTSPTPSHSGHMPSATLKLNALEVPMCGVPRRL